MKYKYDKSTNTLRQLPEMKEPNYENIKYYNEDFSHKTVQWSIDMVKYREHLSSLKSYPCSGEGWEDGKEYEEGEDFEMKDVWKPHGVIGKNHDWFLLDADRSIDYYQQAGYPTLKVAVLKQKEVKVKMTFGLTEKNMEVINKHLSKFDGAKYDRDTWVRIGNEIGWEPLTAAMWYFRKEATDTLKQEDVEHYDIFDLKEVAIYFCDFVLQSPTATKNKDLRQIWAEGEENTKSLVKGIRERKGYKTAGAKQEEDFNVLQWLKDTGRDPMYVSIETHRLLTDMYEYLKQHYTLSPKQITKN